MEVFSPAEMELFSPQFSVSSQRQGGWTAFPFLTATMVGLTLAAGGWMNNLLVYLVNEFNMESVDSAQIWNVVNGCTCFFPIAAAVVADSYLGCYSVIFISSILSFLGIILLLLTSIISTLKPPSCGSDSDTCISPSKQQNAMLFSAITLAVLGVSGTRFTLGTMGANQFSEPSHQRIFWNWFLFTMNGASAISGTVLVYVEDSVSWGLGYGICVAANVAGLVVFVFGKKSYRHVMPEGSPFTGLARVVVAAVSKRKLLLSERSVDYYRQEEVEGPTPTKAFKFLNRAAMKTEGDLENDGSIAKPWRLSTIQQVEDLKTLIRIIPLWSTGTFLVTPLAMQMGLATLQALKLDRHIGSDFKIPAGSVSVLILIFTAIGIVIIDRLVIPLWKKFVGRELRPLQRVGIGHVFTVLSMVVSAMVEAKRLRVVKSHHLQDDDDTTVPMSVLWLLPELALAGVGDSFGLPGNVEFYYQEFPRPLKSTSTAVVSAIVGIAFYTSTGLTGLFRKVTSWLPDNINHGRLDNVYWVLGLMCLVNFFYYLICAWFYKYQDGDSVVPDDSLDSDEEQAQR